jgi:SAM-dependent methyltransferase
MADSVLNASSSATRKRWEARYSEGNTPWDSQMTPPEVVDFWQSSRLPKQGLALDLGCGPGTNVSFLAGLGLNAIGIEIASAPLLTAQSRIKQHAPEVLDRVHFLCSDVCLLPFNALEAAYILDVGCFHSLPRQIRSHYVNSVVTNLRHGGYYHLYAFDSDPANPDPVSGPVGLEPGEVAERFAPQLEVVEEIVARPDRRPCRWYLLRRT